MNALRTTVVALGIFMVICCVYSQGGKWGKWKAVTRCDAKPCECHTDKKDKNGDIKCERGERVMMRICDFDGINACKLEAGEASMKKERCKNRGVCPGWSDWQPTEECNCIGGGLEGTQNAERHCNNPPPLHRDVLCETEDHDNRKEEKRRDPCQCEEEAEEEEETTTQFMTTAAELPCCNTTEYGDYYGEGVENIDVKDYKPPDDSEETGAQTTSSTPDYYDLYPDAKDCRLCNGTESDGTTEMP